MGEYHLVPAFGQNAVCGEPAHPGVAVTLFLKVATCPRCITLLRRLLPTVQVMDGETGEDECGVEQRWVCMDYDGEHDYWEPVCTTVEDWLDGPPGIPAPTPRAP